MIIDKHTLSLPKKPIAELHIGSLTLLLDFYPNSFNRLFQRLFLGFKWEKINVSK